MRVHDDTLKATASWSHLRGSCDEDRSNAKASYERHRPHYEAALRAFDCSLRRLLSKHDLTPTIKCRVKQFHSYIRKLETLQTGGTGDHTVVIEDMLGLRVISPFLRDVESIRDLITQNFPVTEVDQKRYRHSFNEFGYDSVHLTVRLPPGALPSVIPHTQSVCEVQLRTILQDAWAEVEHQLVYKADPTLGNHSMKRKLASLNAMFTLSDVILQELCDQQRDAGEPTQRRVG